MAGEFEGDDQLRERLHEATSGDAAVRQLRRRYDALRQDYEQLLDRLADLEERFEPATATVSSDPLESINQALASPLLDLRDAYVAAANRIQAVVGGLERLADGALKGQRSAPAAPPAPRPQPPTEEAAPAPQPQPAAPEPPQAHPSRPGRVSLDVQGSGFGDLLDFQERLSAVTGVARVTITAIEADRATLSVELVSNPRE